ncbi:MAG: response regulator transcription factor [Catenulispora sp.]|nr:response regulator transcription factor [Catenulispora sp.]
MPGLPAAPGAAEILVVDDEPGIRAVLASSLEFEGYAVRTANDGRAALAEVERGRPDLVVLDVLMPGMDGLTACRRLRAADPHLPVLMLTARDLTGDRVAGLDAGADDYLAKPFELDELLARVRALLRRGALTGDGVVAGTAGGLAGNHGEHVLAYEDLQMDTLTREVTRAGHPIELTRTEYLLLEMFLSHPRQALTREQILRAVWGFDFEPASNSLDVYVMYVRKKTEINGLPRLIQTVRGVGYALRMPAGAGSGAGPDAGSGTGR